MGFSKEVKEEIFVRCARHCCVCRKVVGLNIEVHHIKPRSQGGEDTFENAIALCFDCHANAGHYFAGHPKGSKLSPSELIKHKESWFKIVETNKIKPPPEHFIEVLINNRKLEDKFHPVFVREETRYINKKSMLQFYELTRIDPMDQIRERIKKNTWDSPFYLPGLNKVKTYDEYLDFMSNNNFKWEDENENTDCQPLNHSMDMMKMYKYRELNRSNCVLDLSIKNISHTILEDYKLYLHFENVVNVDSVNKNVEYLDLNNYEYNIKFDSEFKGEFIPDQNILVQKDSAKIDSICFRTKHNIKNVILKWELFARNIRDKGEIDLQIEPIIEDEELKVRYVNSNDKSPTIRILPKLDFE